MRILRSVRQCALLLLCSLVLPVIALADEIDVPPVTQKSSWGALLVIALVALCLAVSVILVRKYRK